MTRRAVGDPKEPVDSARGRPEGRHAASGDAALAAPCDACFDGAESGDRDRRSAERIDVLWSVDCETDETFLYAAITNISAMGIFVRTDDPLPVGTRVTLRFDPHAHASLHTEAFATLEPFALSGTVQWVNARRPHSDNPNPGMGIRFSSLSPAERERIVEAIRTIAYLREEPRPRMIDAGN